MVRFCLKIDPVFKTNVLVLRLSNELKANLPRLHYFIPNEIFCLFLKVEFLVMARRDQ